MEGIKIPQELLEEFRAGSAGPVDGSGGSEASGLTMKSLEKSLAWISKVGDDFAKERGYPGLGKMSSEDFAELAAICAERNFEDWILEKSPEAMFIGVCLGIFFSNLAAASRIKKEAEKKAKEEKQSDEK